MVPNQDQKDLFENLVMWKKKLDLRKIEAEKNKDSVNSQKIIAFPRKINKD